MRSQSLRVHLLSRDEVYGSGSVFLTMSARLLVVYRAGRRERTWRLGVDLQRSSQEGQSRLREVGTPSREWCWCRAYFLAGLQNLGRLERRLEAQT